MIAIGFDFDHTLGFDNGLERNALFDLGEELGAPLDRSDEREHARLNALLHRFREWEITMPAMIEEFVASLVPRPVPNTLVYEDRFKALAIARVGGLSPTPGARELLDELDRRDIPYAILTNGWSPLQQCKVKAIGHLGAVIVSDELGVAKPHPGAFLALSRALGASPEHTYFVGDNPLTDIIGAQRAGMRAIWFDLGEHAYPADQAPPFARITAFDQLLALLPGPGTDA